MWSHSSSFFPKLVPHHALSCLFSFPLPSDISPLQKGSHSILFIFSVNPQLSRILYQDLLVGSLISPPRDSLTPQPLLPGFLAWLWISAWHALPLSFRIPTPLPGSTLCPCQGSGTCISLPKTHLSATMCQSIKHPTSDRRDINVTHSTLWDAALPMDPAALGPNTSLLWKPPWISCVSPVLVPLVSFLFILFIEHLLCCRFCGMYLRHMISFTPHGILCWEALHSQSTHATVTLRICPRLHTSRWWS